MEAVALVKDYHLCFIVGWLRFLAGRDCLDENSNHQKKKPLTIFHVISSLARRIKTVNSVEQVFKPVELPAHGRGSHSLPAIFNPER